MELFFSIVFVLILCSAEENCPQKSKSHNLYNKEHQIFIKAINDARATNHDVSCDNCTCFEDVIANDLSHFKNGITIDNIQSAHSYGVKYQIINKRVYRTKDCLFPTRCDGVDYFINKVRHELPDVEFAVNFHDWPQINARFTKNVPVFSFSKTDDYLDILFPAWSFWKGGPAIKLYPTGIGNWEEHSKKIVKMANKWPWEKKHNIAFFRGSRTSSERDNLILLSRKEPNLVDAAFTKNQAWKSDKDTLNSPAADEVSLEDHCKYRFLFNFRGVAASFRLKYLFLCKSLVFHVGNEWKEFFYNNLKPWVHYIPVDSSYTEDEIKNMLIFVQNEDKIANEIANNGFNFISNNLNVENIVCYWRKLLTSYSSLLKFKPTLDKTLFDVTV